jgi:hypothetical protein
MHQQDPQNKDLHTIHKMENKQGYIQGMDQDSAFNKRKPNSYFSASNFKVVTDAGSSTGSLETEKGTKLAFSIPDIPELRLTDGTIIPAQSNLKIIGSCTMVDELILFTTNETVTDPSGYGQIWKCKYDENTDTIINITGAGELDPTIHLFYNQQLTFSTEYRIGRAIALYETSDKQRVYWTDNYNPVRTFNLADPNPLDTPLSTINIFSGVTLTQPVFEAYGSGTLPAATQIQFTYNLITTSGVETGYAPPTPLIPLPLQTVAANSFTTFQGGGTGLSKSVTYTLNNLDTNFDAIQHIAILYDSAGLIDIYKFAEDSVPASGELTVTCSSVAGAIIIDPTAYSIINTGFERCKDIEVQGNRLIAANISTDKNELVYDSRAYRFNNPATKYAPESPTFPLGATPVAPIALLQDSNSNIDDLILIGGGSTPVWSSVPDNHDAINITNKEQTLNWFNADQQYKYKADGITLGGEGPNISYEFTTIALPGNTAFEGITNAPNHLAVPSYLPGAAPLYKGVLQADGTPQPIQIQNQLANLSGAWAQSEFTGYSRGEVYRFGIVFYDNKGVPSFVKWIGDIRFPDVSDGYPLQTYTDSVAYVNQLGIEFDIDVSSISTLISGYSIVRLPREDKDKTKLGTGFHMLFDQGNESKAVSLMHRYFLTGLGLGSGTPENDPYPVTGDYEKGGDDTGRFMHLSDKPGFNSFTIGITNEGGNDMQRAGYLISPFGNLYTSDWTSNDYLETLEYYNAELRNYYDDAGATGTAGNLANFAFYYKMKEQADPTHGFERIQIQKSKDLFAGEVISVGDSYLSDLVATPDLGNASYTRQKAALVGSSRELYPLGIGCSKRLLRLHMPKVNVAATDIPTTIPNVTFNNIQYQNVASPGGNTNWNGPDGVGKITIEFTGKKSDTDVTFKSVGYRRYLNLQYEGDSWESRSINEYLYIGHFQSTNNAAALNLSTRVFGGDTYVNYYDEETIERYVDPTQNPQSYFKPSDTNNLGVAVCGPVESSVNTNWRTGRNWAKDREISNMAAYAQNTTIIYPVWNQEDEVQRKFFAEDFLAQFVEEHPFQLWASDIKINGELLDNWRSFPIANKTEVDGIYGPINRIISFKDNLLFYQDRAFGIASLDERTVIQDGSGQELVLGVGGVFPDYKYMSTNTGSVHQFDVVDSENAVYHYDARRKKFMVFSGSPESVSDVKGMSSFFAKEVQGNVTNTDKTLRDFTPSGVHGIYDARYNRLLYTFLIHRDAPNISTFLAEDGGYEIPAGSYVQISSIVYYVPNALDIPATDPPTLPELSIYAGVEEKMLQFTIGYNEMMQAFESFYDFYPGMYLEYGRRLLSVSHLDSGKLYQHNVGPYGQYYDTINSVSKLHTVFSDPSSVTKIWNNLSWLSEKYDNNKIDVWNETIDRIKFFNEYQETALNTLTPGTNVKRRMRTWRMAIPREVDKALSRLRNPWLECIAEYDNIDGYRKVLHELTYSFTPASM